jgi:uncharacterized protein YcbX
MTPFIRHLITYPIKSLAGIPCDEFVLGDRGAQGDRRWMLVDDGGRFISQREWPKLCLFGVDNGDNGYEIRSAVGDIVHVPAALEQGKTVSVGVWSDQVEAIQAADEINRFFSESLDMPCRLVFMPETSHRLVDAAYAGEGMLTSFSDAYPLLVIGSASLDELNARLKKAGESEIGWDRFRPNIVVDTEESHVEDTWAEFTIGEVACRGVKLCSRCVMTTIDQQSGLGGKEPLRSLAQYRSMKNKVMFGQNVIAGKGIVRVGDAINVIRKGYPPNAVF